MIEDGMENSIIIDTHIHLSLNKRAEEELSQSKMNVQKMINDLSLDLSHKNIKKGLLYILDLNILWKNFQIPNNIIASSAISFNSSTSYCDEQLAAGIKIFKTHPYLHEITKDKYKCITEFAEYIGQNGGILTICGSYGSSLLYETNGVELAAFIKKRCDVPIIIAHGGMPRIFDAMSLALEYDDIYMDFSFTFPFWWGSTIIQDYAFAARKLGCERIFYGSDYPYVSFEDSKRYFNMFLQTYEFDEESCNRLYYKNFIDFEKRYL